MGSSKAIMNLIVTLMASLATRCANRHWQLQTHIDLPLGARIPKYVLRSHQSVTSHYRCTMFMPVKLGAHKRVHVDYFPMNKMLSPTRSLSRSVGCKCDRIRLGPHRTIN
ncbi:hypothetical protein EI94DRAFT_888625 [Lactarius quietus]|nr:hypothetical protein EI94DRAFT_888625 [Lactarius quietus]